MISKMMKVGMEFFIDYAHYIPGHELCGKPHGHTAKIEVQLIASTFQYDKIKAFKDNYNDSIVIDFKEFKEKVKSVIDQLDHEDLNTLFVYPSSECVCHFIFSKLLRIFSQDERCHLYSVRFYEGNGKYVEIVNS